ncbi:RibD family protein [Marinactinospora thermotolerans]|nr:dihydrofolate reductase family protein [Marinactinospora thermotolerans]
MTAPAPNGRPHTILSCAMSIDGHIDDTSADRLRLSDEADFDRVDELRAGCDAILIGAGTVRADDPRLLVRSPQRRARRIAEGRDEQLLKVVLSARGDIDPRARVLSTGAPGAVVYVADPAHAATARRLADLPDVDVVAVGDPPDPARALADLARRGVRRLMVEGGGAVHTAFLSAGLADELHLAVAPFLIGDPEAPRFVHPADFPNGPARPMRLAGVEQVGTMAVLRYLPGAAT